MTLIGKKLIPDTGKHLKNLETGDIYDTYIYLSIYAKPEDYVEVSEEEYQEWLNREVEVE